MDIILYINQCEIYHKTKCKLSIKTINMSNMIFFKMCGHLLSHTGQTLHLRVFVLIRFCIGIPKQLFIEDLADFK